MKDFFPEQTAARKKFLEENVRPEILSLHEAGKTLSTITWRRIKEAGMNSYERELMYPLLGIPDLIECCEYAVKNTSTSPPYRKDFGPVPGTYEEALIHTFMPLLLKALRAPEAMRKPVPKVWRYYRIADIKEKSKPFPSDGLIDGPKSKIINTNPGRSVRIDLTYDHPLSNEDQQAYELNLVLPNSADLRSAGLKIKGFREDLPHVKAEREASPK